MHGGSSSHGNVIDRGPQPRPRSTPLLPRAQVMPGESETQRQALSWRSRACLKDPSGPCTTSETSWRPLAVPSSVLPSAPGGPSCSASGGPQLGFRSSRRLPPSQGVSQARSGFSELADKLSLLPNEFPFHERYFDVLCLHAHF